MFAVAYFLLTFNRTLNLADEGYLLYNFAKTAEGQLPHRDFYDAYGPAVYWVGAALFKLFGTKVIVVRVFMVALKTIMALLIMLIGVRIVPPLFAFLASLLFVFNWGDPLIGPVNALYAGHVNHFLTLSGIFAMMLYLHSERKRWLFCTSACIGLSALFKLHMAGVDFIGFALLLSLREQGRGPAISETSFSDAWARLTAIRLLRAMKILGIVGVAVFYFIYLAGPNLSVAGFLVFNLPLCLLVGHVLIPEFRAFRDIRRETASIHRERLLALCGELAALVSFPALFILSVAILYLTLGGLPDLLHDVFALPGYIKYHHSMSDSGLIASITVGVVFAAALATQLGKLIKRKGEKIRYLFAGATALLLILLVAAALYTEVPYRAWHRVATHALLPAPLLIGVCLFIIRRSRQQRSSDDIRGFWSLGLILIFAAQSLLLMSMRADETHIVIYSTVIFAAIAFTLHELYQGLRRMRPGGSSAAACVAVAACLAAISIPYLWSVKILFVPTFPKNAERPAQYERGDSYPTLIPDAPRAWGLRLPVWPYFTPPLNHPMLINMNKTIDFIREQTAPEERIFLTCGDQMIYFLSERGSVLGKENYFAYLANMQFIDRTNTGRVSDDDILEKLATANPRFVIQTPAYADTVYFAHTFPKVSEFIRNGYVVDTVFGEYQILRRRGSAPSSHRGAQPQ